MKRYPYYALLAGAALVSGAVYAGPGSHTLTKPSSVGSYSPPQEYEWDSGEAPFSIAYVKPVVEDLLRELKPGARVLDLGCGNGAMVGSFLGKEWHLVGVDVSKSGIEQARRRWPAARFEVGDATEDLTGLGQFDAIYSTEVIEHVMLPRRFAQNCFRLLKPGGVVVLSTPYHGWLKNVTIAVVNGSDEHFGPLMDWGHIKFWSPKTLAKLLWEAGFDDVQWKGAGRAPFLWKSMVMRARRPA